MAMELYRSEKVSMSRAAEIAGVSIEGFKNFCESKGVKWIVLAPPEEKMKKAAEFLLG
jgi:hypothetical protein